jgi:hypothetical protein
MIPFLSESVALVGNEILCFQQIILELEQFDPAPFMIQSVC